MNKIIISGNLCADPELRYTGSGIAVADVNLASNRTWTQDGEKKEETTFVNVTFWKKSAELVVQYLKKGDKLLVDGRLDQENWVDKESGGNRSKLKITAERMEFIGGKKSEGQQAPQQQSTQPQQGQPSVPPQQAPQGQSPAQPPQPQQPPLQNNALNPNVGSESDIPF